VLAWLTYRFVEKPVRRSAHMQRTAWLWVAAMAVVGTAGYVTYHQQGFASTYPRFIREIAAVNTASVEQWRQHHCFLESADDKNAFGAECLDASKKNHIFLWGDSHAASLYSGLKVWAVQHDASVSQYTATYCAPLVNYHNPHRPFCDEINQETLRQIQRSKPTTLVLMANWANPYYPYDALQTTVDALRAAGVTKVVIIGPVPLWQEPLPRAIALYWRKHKHLPPSYMHAMLSPKFATSDAQLRQQAAVMKVDYISPLETFCNDKGCLTRFGDESGELTAFDDTHLSPKASAYFIQKIGNYFLSKP
jgi:hypothetical protein